MRAAVIRLAWISAAIAWSVGNAVAAPFFAGRVTARNGTPLADVRVQVEIRHVATARSTDAQGHFEVDAGTLFPANELRDVDRVMIELSKPGFQAVNKLVRVVAGEAPAVVNVQLDPTGGSAALDATEKETLSRYVAAPGTAPLFLVPYSLSGISGDPNTLNDRLRANLERVIVVHLQAADLAASGMVSLKLLPATATNDIDRLRAYVAYLKALGVITGYGAVETPSGGSATLDVSSTFLVIPDVPPLTQPVLYVDDDLPADRVTSPRLYQSLSKLWGRTAVLALGLSEFDAARTAGDKAALKRIRTYLQAERAGAGPGDETLLSQLGALIDAVDKELAQ